MRSLSPENTSIKRVSPSYDSPSVRTFILHCPYLKILLDTPGSIAEEPFLCVLSIEKNAEMMTTICLNDELAKLTAYLAPREHSGSLHLIVHEFLENHACKSRLKVKEFRRQHFTMKHDPIDIVVGANADEIDDIFLMFDGCSTSDAFNEFSSPLIHYTKLK
jgi:hypothetical protein